MRHSGLFLCEGTSDLPIAGLVESLFFECGIELNLVTPDLSLLNERVRSSLPNKLAAARRLLGYDPEVIVVHRDADGAGRRKRVEEMRRAVDDSGVISLLLPVVPMRMTEAWLLLDESAIRRVAGHPNGRHTLDLPKIGEVERLADPKALLQQSILRASGATGRRRDRLASRFGENRRQLLSALELQGAVAQLEAWSTLVREVEVLSNVIRARS